MSETPIQATVKETIAANLARDIADGEVVSVGANLAVARAAALLAHLTSGPNMTIVMGMSKANIRHVPRIEEFKFLSDHRSGRWAEAYFRHDEFMANMRYRRNSVFFAGALQVDPFGNSNLIGIGTDPSRLRFRGPGPIGTCNGAAMFDRFHLVLNAHDRRIFVPECDFVSAFGWRRGETTREDLALPGGGPRFVVTPLCIMDFETPDRRMRLRSVHAGVSMEQVRDATGFDLAMPGDVPTTPPPTTGELAILRERIDPSGSLRVAADTDPRRD